MEVTQEDIFWKRVSGVGINFNQLPNHILFVKLAAEENRIEKLEITDSTIRMLIKPFYIKNVNDNPLTAVIKYNLHEKYISCSIDVAGDKYYSLLFPTTIENVTEYSSLICVLKEIKNGKRN